MTNRQIAKIFYEISDFLAAKDTDFKPFAYKRGAEALESLKEDINKIYKGKGIKGLKEIPGIGQSLAESIEEYLKTGKIEYYQKLKKNLPVDFQELIAVEGLGPRKINILYKKLDIKNIKELEVAAKKGKIRNLEGFGEKTEKNILEGISFLKRDKGRFLLQEIMPFVQEIYKKLSHLKETEEISLAGSLRRMKETIGDADILVVSKNPKKVMDFFVSLPGVVKVWAKGQTRSSIRTDYGFDVDLRIVRKESFGSALQYFTGSKEHNIATRRIAQEKGLKLNEYGIFKGSKMIGGKTEKEIYNLIGLPFIPPEIREDRGEIEFFLGGNSLDIIGYGNVKGDLHCHSNWNGGENSIEEMAEYAKEMGYEYIGISDHTKFLKIEKGLDEKQLIEQREEIKRLNDKIQSSNAKSNPKSKFQILQGCEANIMPDGSIDIKDEVLEQLDFVIAGVHSRLKMDKNNMTERIIKAMENSNIDIISHPTGRLLLKRDEYQIDFDKLLEKAKKTGTILEINSSPQRLDLKDVNIRKARDYGVKMIINTDSHQREQMDFMKYGIGQARRGWAEKKDIINTHPLEELLNFFK